MSEMFICIDCELTNPQADPTSLNAHGMCARCGSSSVVPVDTFSVLANKAKAKADFVRETPTDQTRARWEAMKAQRARDHEPLRGFLQSLIYSKMPSDYAESAERVLNEQLEIAIASWDGWAYQVHYPWVARGDEFDIENPIPGYFVIELVSCSKVIPTYMIGIDAFLHQIKQIVP